MAERGRVERPFTVTHRLVLGIAVPMTLAHLSTPLLGITDTAVIGRLGDPALLGGLAIGAVIFDIVFTTFNFLKTGTTALTAQALGAEDAREERAVLYRALLVALGLGFATVVLQMPLLWLSLWAMGASAAVSEATSAYFAVRILAAPLTLINYAILGWMLGLGRGGTALALQVLLNGINIALTILFVMRYEMGIAGAAWATVVAEAVAVVAGLALARVRLGARLGMSRAELLDPVPLKRLVAVNRDIMIRSFCLIAAFAFFAAAGARQGDVTLAANAILFNFFLVASYFLDGMAAAAEQLSGRAVGARHRPAFERAMKLTIGWGYALALPASLLLFLFGNAMIDLMTTSAEVRAAARLFLFWAALTPLAGVLAFQFDGIFIGATWSRDMRDMMIASLALFIAAWWVATPLMGNHGLWLAFLLFLGVRGLSLGWRYRARIEQEFGAPRPVVALAR